MAFLTGLMLIDAPASALNNAGILQNQQDRNTVGIKAIQAKDGGIYPYFTAQAYRYWLREITLPHLEWKDQEKWVNSPTFREAENLAYTAADPIDFWDDDIFGYMRAPSAKTLVSRKNDPIYQQLTPLEIEKKKKDGKETEAEVTLTRVSPLRVSTFVSIAPVNITEHQESMSRHEGDPVLYRSQFYKATLQGLFSLNLHACGTFSYLKRTGYRNLDKIRIEKIQQIEGWEQLKNENAYRLPLEMRRKRIEGLLRGMAHIEGGAKLATHYTDVSPVFLIMAVTHGGNHMFAHIIDAVKGEPKVNLEALVEQVTELNDELCSNVFVGWTPGYYENERKDFDTRVKQIKEAHDPKASALERLTTSVHPRRAFYNIIDALQNNAQWLD